VVPAVQEETIEDNEEDLDDLDEGMDPFINDPETWAWESGATSLVSTVAVATCLLLQY